jgi:hypothetical protein
VEDTDEEEAGEVVEDTEEEETEELGDISDHL